MSQVNLSERALSIEPSLTLQISAKANQLSSEGVDICNLSAGEPDFNAPKEVIEATSKAIFDGFTKYGPAAGNLDLRKAIANKLQIQNNLNIEFENVMVTNGAKQAIYTLFQVLLNAGDAFNKTWKRLYIACLAPFVIITFSNSIFKLF